MFVLIQVHETHDRFGDKQMRKTSVPSIVFSSFELKIQTASGDMHYSIPVSSKRNKAIVDYIGDFFYLLIQRKSPFSERTHNSISSVERKIDFFSSRSRLKVKFNLRCYKVFIH